jgi:hypothetical protein
MYTAPYIIHHISCFANRLFCEKGLIISGTGAFARNFVSFFMFCRMQPPISLFYRRCAFDLPDVKTRLQSTKVGFVCRIWFAWAMSFAFAKCVPLRGAGGCPVPPAPLGGKRREPE